MSDGKATSMVEHKTILALWLCVSMAAYLNGCGGKSAADRAGGRPNETTDGNPQQRLRVEEYVSRMSPQLRDHGFPDIRLEPVEQDGTLRIRVFGTVTSTSEQGRKDNQIVLESVLRASEPPADIMMDVQYQVKY